MESQEIDDVIDRWVEKVSDTIPPNLREKFRKVVTEFLSDLFSGKRTLEEQMDHLDESFLEELIRSGQNPANFVKRIDVFYEILSETYKGRLQELSPIFAKFETKFIEKVLGIYSRVVTEEIEKKRKIERALKIMAKINDAIMRTENERDMLNEICKIIVEIGSYHYAWISYVENGGKVKPVTRCVSLYPLSPNMLRDVNNLETPVLAALKSEKPVITRNVYWGYDAHSSRTISFRGVQNCLLTLPLQYMGKTYGAIGIFLIGGEEFDSEEQNLLAKLAENISYAISKIRTEKEKERIDMLYRLLLDNTGTGIVLLEEDIILFANKKMEDFLGMRKNSLIGRRFTEFVHQKDRKTVEDIHRKIMHGEYFESSSYRIHYTTSDGHLKEGMCIVTRILDENKLIISLIDTTDLMLATRQIEENIETFAILVDKIRNPLTAIYGFVDEFGKDDKMKRVVFEQIDRIVELIEGLEEGWLESDDVKNFLEKSKNITQ